MKQIQKRHIPVYTQKHLHNTYSTLLQTMLDWFRRSIEFHNNKIKCQKNYICKLHTLCCWHQYACIYLYYHWKTTNTFLCFSILCHFHLKSNIGHCLDKLIINHNNLNLTKVINSSTYHPIPLLDPTSHPCYNVFYPLLQIFWWMSGCKPYLPLSNILKHQV